MEVRDELGEIKKFRYTPRTFRAELQVLGETVSLERIWSDMMMDKGWEKWMKEEAQTKVNDVWWKFVATCSRAS